MDTQSIYTFHCHRHRSMARIYLNTAFEGTAIENVTPLPSAGKQQ